MTERRLTDEQREIIADSIPGGLVAYIQRLSEGHWPTFGMGKQGRYLGSCICGEVLCHRWAIAAYRRDLLDAYQAKVDDFAAETLRAVPESDELVRLRAERDAAMALLAKVVSVAPRKALPWVSPLSLSFGSTPLTLEESALMKRATDEYAALSPDEAAEYVYRTTNTVRCEWCGAEPGQSCRLEPGRYAGYGTTEKFHTIRVDPTSEPVGILGPKREGNAFREILPLPEAAEKEDRD